MSQIIFANGGIDTRQAAATSEKLAPHQFVSGCGSEGCSSEIDAWALMPSSIAMLS
jgi:hypothetical protein